MAVGHLPRRRSGFSTYLPACLLLSLSLSLVSLLPCCFAVRHAARRPIQARLISQAAKQVTQPTQHSQPSQLAQPANPANRPTAANRPPGVPADQPAAGHVGPRAPLSAALRRQRRPADGSLAGVFAASAPATCRCIRT